MTKQNIIRIVISKLACLNNLHNMFTNMLKNKTRNKSQAGHTLNNTFIVII